MCGRFTHLYRWRQLHRLMGLAVPAVEEVPLSTRFNVAPTQLAPVVREVDGTRRADMLRWGLVPPWAKDEAVGSQMINSRSETAATKPAYRSAFKHRRCVVPVSGFYEWDKFGTGKRKQPWYFEPADGKAKAGESVFAFAGLWESWKSPVGAELLSFTILTTTPNELLAPLHDRMPVILPPERIAEWLDSRTDDLTALQPFLKPYPAASMQSHTVSPWVNAPAHDDARCIERSQPEAAERGLFD